MHLCQLALALLLAAALLPAPAIALQEIADSTYLTALPKPSTRPFGLRLAIADTIEPPYSSSAVSLTWSTTAPLTHPPCAELTQIKYHKNMNNLRRFGRQGSSLEDPKNQVLYLSNANTTSICGSSATFIEPATQLATHFIHTVLLSYLENSSKYQYKCGNDVDGWSELHSFLPPPPRGVSGGNRSTNLLLLGDMGVAHALTLPYLIKEANTGIETDDSNAKYSQNSPSSLYYSAILHVGDLAYDLNHYQGRKAQHFLRMIEPISSSLPYMVAPGNHEAAFNFSLYRSLFKMPQWQQSQNLYFSFDIGLVHIVVYNTEVFFWPESFGTEHMQQMFEWLERDLKQANENRKQVPWVIAIGHRPMYCASSMISTSINSGTSSRVPQSVMYEETLPSGTKSTTNSTTKSNISSSIRDDDIFQETLELPWCGWEAEASRRGIPSICPHNNPRWCHRAATRSGGTGDTNADSSSTTTPTFPIEELFKKYNVDLFVAGHVHDYERYWPVYNYTYTSYPTVDIGKETLNPKKSNKNTTSSSEKQQQPIFYKNPNATVHIISGAGGNTEMRIGPGVPPQGPCSADTPWCAFQSGHGPLLQQGYDFSYSRIFVHNSSHLQWQQYSATFERVIDEFWVVQQDGVHRFSS
jgi:Calcineurin-like phosphoesterase/Iron/zinc purple acid phosphatase-like protein C